MRPESTKGTTAPTDVERIDAAVDGWGDIVSGLDLETMRLGLLVAHVAARMHLLVDSLLGEVGLSSGEFDVLASLLHAPERSLTPTELARFGMLSPSGMTHRLDRLEGLGLIERSQNLHDRRSTRITLTALGYERTLAGVSVHVGGGSLISAAFSDSDRREFRRLLSAALDALSGPPTTQPRDSA